jgi:hypothetical protein
LVIEHTFVTTLDSHDALALASDMLSRRGFESEGESGFQLGEGWTTLQMRRGKKSASRAKSLAECPQQVRLEWDRGRVSVAAVMEPWTRRRSFAIGPSIGGDVSITRNKKGTKDATDLMFALANGLERLLAEHQPAEEAIQEWATLEDAKVEQARKSRVRSWIFLGIFFAIIIGFIIFAVVMANSR